MGRNVSRTWGWKAVSMYQYCPLAAAGDFRVGPGDMSEAGQLWDLSTGLSVYCMNVLYVCCMCAVFPQLVLSCLGQK
jgi:hypothetical protein